MKIVTLHPVTITRAELIAHARWPDHDPGDEDEPSWLTAPVAPSRSLWNLMLRPMMEQESDYEKRNRELHRLARLAGEDMMPYLGYLVANLTIASNLRYADELRALDAMNDALERRLNALGWKIAGQWGEGLITPNGNWHDWPEDDDLEAFVVRLEQAHR